MLHLRLIGRIVGDGPYERSLRIARINAQASGGGRLVGQERFSCGRVEHAGHVQAASGLKALYRFLERHALLAVDHARREAGAVEQDLGVEDGAVKAAAAGGGWGGRKRGGWGQGV